MVWKVHFFPSCFYDTILHWVHTINWKLNQLPKIKTNCSMDLINNSNNLAVGIRYKLKLNLQFTTKMGGSAF